MKGLVLALALLVAFHGGRGAACAEDRVDLRLVIAIDVSVSMDQRERMTAQAGFAEAFLDPRVIAAITSGPRGQIAVTCFLWGGEDQVLLLLPWTRVDGPAAGRTVAATIAATPFPTLQRGTATGDALRYAASLLAASPFASERQVVNIASDGVSNAGTQVATMRADLLAAGVTINAMPVLTEGPGTDTPAMAAWNAVVSKFFETRVIGGPDAFVEPARGADDLVAAVRRKLIREIGGPMIVAGLR